MKYLTSILLITLALMGNSQNHPAQFVWKDAAGSGRQQKVLFRNSFECTALPDQAVINLFADSRYHLYVNGTHVNFGPSRFYLEHPQYDSYNVANLLKKGPNTIAVEVLANGMESFQLPASIGGFISWGEFKTDKTKVNLETPGSWLMLPVQSMDTAMVKFSFATASVENFDGNEEPSGWENADFDDSNWMKPVEITNQTHWGELTARIIPPLTQLEKTAFECLGIYAEQSAEEVHSFYEKSADETSSKYNAGQQMMGYTYIWSPRDQQVELGTWWGDYYLNGEGPLKVSSKSESNIVRENRTFELKKGWNYLFVAYRAIWGAWEFTLAVPKDAGLKFSANQQEDDQVFFRTVKVGSKEEASALVDQFKNNEKALQRSLKKQGWKDHADEQTIRNPSRDLIWNAPDFTKNLISNDYQTTNFQIDQARYFVFDMGNKTLGRLFVDVDAPKGTNIELGWSEDLNAQNIPYLYKRLQINSGARFITNGTDKRYSTFKPYGVRYILVKIVPPANQNVRLKQLGVIEQEYPYQKLGSFECSDPLFNKIWELGWRTIKVCSEDSYIDTPFRERGLYAGDALPEYAITLATSGDSRLMKRSLQLFQDMYHEELMTGSENRHNDFILKTLIELYWYYKYTGDTAFVRELYPSYKSYLDRVEKRLTPQGYYQTGRVFLEWTQINRTADLAAYQALVYGSLQILGELSTDLGIGDEQVYSDRAAKLKQVINTKFWDENQQAFFDGFDKGEKVNHYYPISSYYPLLFDAIKDDQRKEEVIRFLDEELKDIGEETRNRKTTPYSAFYLFAGLYQNGEAAIAERFMRQYWTRMILQGDDTSWENFDIGAENGGGQGTASHAWSGHPTYFLSTEVLGVKMGFNRPFSRDTIFIQPQTESVMWARGTVPHPAGPVKIGWRIQGENLIFKVVAPAGIPVIVEPKDRLKKLNLILTVVHE